MSMIGPQEIDCDLDLFLFGQSVKPEEIFLGLQATIAPHLDLLHLVTKAKSLLLKNLGSLCPGTGGEVVVMAFGSQQVNKKLARIALHEYAQISDLQQLNDNHQ